MYVDTNIFTFMKLDSLYWKLMEYNYNGKVVQNYIAFIMLSWTISVGIQTRRVIRSGVLSNWSLEEFNF